MKLIPAFTLLLSLFNLSSSAQNVNGHSFKEYPVNAVYKGLKAKLDLSSNRNAAFHKAAITAAYKKGKPDFAGNYVTVIWSCGTGCNTGVMVDARDGKIYDLPNVKNNNISNCSEGTANGGMLKSRMYVITDCGNGEDEPVYTVFTWNEKEKQFKEILPPSRRKM